MPTLLRNMKIQFISLVKEGANKRSIIFKSGEEDPPIMFEIPIKKIDEENRRFYSIVYAPDDVDTQGEFTTAPEIQKASYDFMKNLRLHNLDRNHDNAPTGDAFVAESWLLKEKDPIFPEDPAGSWAVGIIVESEELWKTVKSGEINALSMGGSGEKIPDQEIGKQFEEKENQIHYTIRSSGLFEDGTLRTVRLSTTKSGVTMIVGRLKGQTSTTAQGLRFNKSNWTMAEARKWVSDHPEIKKADYHETLDEDDERLGKRILKALGSLLNTQNDEEGGDQDMKKDEVQEMIDKAIEPIKKSIEELPKALSKDDLLKVFGEGVKPLTERIEKMEKKTKGSAQDDDEDIKKDKDLDALGQEMAKSVNEA